VPRYIAFLRAINVGGHNVKMDHLRTLFESLSLTNVQTLIASGNVIFDTRSRDAGALEIRIENHLRDALGYAVSTFLRTPAEIRAAAGHDAFPPAGSEGCALSIGFTKMPPEDAVRRKLISLSTDLDRFQIRDREVYWLCRGRVSDSKFSGAIAEKILGMPATFRNVTTVRKLAEQY